MEIPTSRRAWVLESGDIDNLRLESFAVSPPGDAEVLVSVRAVGLNMADVFSVLGLYGATPKGVFTPGLEFSGDVIQAGPGSKFKVGDRVMGCSRFGSYTTHITAPANLLRSIPEEWSYAEGAACLVQGLTMMYALRSLANIQRGHLVLVHSLAGGCGQFAAKICK